MKKKFFMVFLFLLIVFKFSFSVEFIGRFGNVYDIKERDFLEELYEAAKRLDYENLKKEAKKKILNYKPKNLIRLIKAEKSEVYYVDYEFELPEDIKIPINGEWRVLYKKGFKFKPLKYITFKPVDLLIFNGLDEKELNFVKTNFVEKNIRVKYVISDGNYRDVMKKLRVPVYYLFGKQFEVLNLKYTISRVSVDIKKGLFRIDVYALDKNGKLKGEYVLGENSYLKVKHVKNKKSKVSK